MKLKGIIKIQGNIRAISGISIGSTSSALEVNVYENDIIKTSQGVPYISGSSLKGKLRDMLAKIAGSKDEIEDLEENPNISKLFGSPENIKENNLAIDSRLLIQDAYAKTIIEKRGNKIIKRFADDKFINAQTEYSFVELKTENTIDRFSKKSMPRKLIRTLPEAIFPFELKYKILDNDKNEHLKQIKTALKMLEDEYIGGNGSRGNGQIEFEKVEVTEYLITDFVLNKKGTMLYTDLLNQEIN